MSVIKNIPYCGETWSYSRFFNFLNISYFAIIDIIINLLTFNIAKIYWTTKVIQLYRQDDTMYLFKHLSSLLK